MNIYMGMDKCVLMYAILVSVTDNFLYYGEAGAHKSNI